jgi:hypothetical protein
MSLRILVLGYIVRGPLGGLAWHHLQYVMGLARLGHDVWFLEDSDDYPSCYDPVRNVTDTDPTYGLAFTGAAFGRVGLADRWAYHDAHTERWLGPAAPRARELAATAEVLLNLSAVNPLRPWLLQVPQRALVDTDPVFTQIRHLTEPTAMRRAREHTAFLTFGENYGLEPVALGQSTSGIPADGLPWQPTRQPVVLDAWPVTPGRPGGRFTTVMQWESYPAREHAGIRYGMKAESFAPYIDLPAGAGPVFELALGSPGAPRDLLRARGWRLRDPRRPTRDPWIYQRYLRHSKAEFGIAKHGYVVSESGWFSERTAAYLASGRPAVVQETGFSRWLPTGVGVIPFRSPAEALAGVAEVDARYPQHCRAAREVAAAHFDSDRVLSDLITRVMRSSACAS